MNHTCALTLGVQNKTDTLWKKLSLHVLNVPKVPGGKLCYKEKSICTDKKTYMYVPLTSLRQATYTIMFSLGENEGNSPSTCRMWAGKKKKKNRFTEKKSNQI